MNNSSEEYEAVLALAAPNGGRAQVSTSTAGLPPHSIEHERSLLSALLFDPSKVDDAREVLSADDFFDPAAREIFRSIEALDDENAPIEVFAITEELKRRDKQAVLGDLPLVGLASAEFSSQVTQVAGVVRAYAGLREIESKTRVVSRECAELKPRDYAEFEAFRDGAEQRIFEACERRPDSNIKPFSDLAPLARDRFESYANHLPTPGAIATGFPTFDVVTGLLQPETANVIAARPSMGKTALVLQIAVNLASTGVAVAFFSLEMSASELMDRAACSEAQINLMKARAGNLNEHESARLGQALDRLSRLPIFIDESPDLPLAAIRARARRMARRHGLKCIVVDYLQLVRPRDVRDNRERQVSEISRGLKILAKELKLPVLVTAQLNRLSEARANHVPQLADLRESGAIEQDADLIVLLHRPEFYNPNERPGEIDVIIAKQRNGPRTTVPMRFEAAFTRFED